MTKSLLILAVATAGLMAQERPDHALPSPLLTPVFRPGDGRQLREGRPVVRVLPAHGAEVILACGVRVNADAEQLAAWGRSLDVYQRGRLVLTTGRFSTPPRLSDLEGLELNDDDLQALRKCTPGDCDLKLSASEMERLKVAITSGGAGWREGTNDTFRRIVLARAESYQAHGLAPAPPYEDKSKPVSPAAAFAEALAPPSVVTLDLPGFADYLLQYPFGDYEHSESYMFWSVEALGRKPAVAITHVLILRGRPDHPAEVVVAAIRVFTTHYVISQLAVTTISLGAAGEPRYLLYVNRSRVDVLGGKLRAFFRQAIEGQIRSEGPDILDTLRRQLESGVQARRKESY